MKKINSIEEYDKEYKKSVEHPEEFWEEQAKYFKWEKKWDKVLEWDFKKPEIKWFVGGKLNITENCLDRHLENRADKTALIWEPNGPSEKSKSFTYKELHNEVCRFANVLKKNHIKKGDRVCIYMPMVPELVFAVLACARIGAVHSVVFAGFSAVSLADRINDAACKMVLTTDEGKRGNKIIPIKAIVDEALENCDTIETVIVFKHTGSKINFKAKRDKWWHEELKKVDNNCKAEVMDSEDMLFILYTSGSTGKPKGLVHTIGGYMVYTCYSFVNVFQYEEDDVYWCTADIGWITGHSYLIYGPLLAGATTVMYEGTPTHPSAGRFWHVVEKHKINIFYTAPTAIRALMAFGREYVDYYDLTSLKVLGTVGEPINEEAWHWYHDVVGKNRCHVVDTWWQTETGGILISPLANITKIKPSYATQPLPGVQPILLNKDGEEITGSHKEGLLCIKFPWPSIARTTYGDHDRYKKVYFSHFKGMYFTGDGAKKDKKGNYRIIGRVDDVINVSGHRLGTAEIENAINQNKSVIESAVVGFPHAIKGQGIYAYIILNNNDKDAEAMAKEIKATVDKEIGPIARPEKIQFVDGLPKTRSGKIMRRILRKIAEGDTANLGDTSTLLDPDVVEDIKNGIIL